MTKPASAHNPEQIFFMTQFFPLTDQFYIAPQITAEDVEAAAEAGVALIVNNRPEGEAPGQPAGETIGAACAELGLDYIALPVGPAGINSEMLDAFNNAFDACIAKDAKALGFCAAGMRAALIYAYGRAKAGEDPAKLAEICGNVGIDMSGHLPALSTLANDAGKA